MENPLTKIRLLVPKRTLAAEHLLVTGALFSCAFLKSQIYPF